MKRVPMIAAAAAAVLLTLAGCAVDQAGGQPTSSKTKGFTFGVSLYASGDTYAAAMARSLKAEAAKLGDKIIIVTDGKFDSQKQGQDVQDILARQPDALLLAAGDTAQGKAWVDESVKAKVPVFSLYNGIGHLGEPLYKGLSGGVQIDEKASGDAAGQIASKYLASGDAAGVVLGAAGYAEVKQRLDGFSSALDKTPGNVKVVSSPNGDWTSEHGQEACQDLISANPKIKVIYSESDGMSIGCTQASNIGSVKVVGNAGSGQGLEAVKAGTMIGTTCYNPEKVAKTTIDLAHAVLAGDTSKKDKLIMLAPAPITAANISECPAQW